MAYKAVHQNLLFAVAVLTVITLERVSGQKTRPIPLCVTGMEWRPDAIR